MIAFVSMPCMIFGSFMARNHFNPKIQICIGGAIGIIGCFLSSMTNNIWSFILLFSVSFGMANGFTYIVPLHLSWKYFKPEDSSNRREGLITGIVIAGFGFGGVIFGIISENLINPDRLDPEYDEDGNL